LRIVRENANSAPQRDYTYNECAPRFGVRLEQANMHTRLAKKKTPPRKIKTKAPDRPVQWKLRRRGGLQILESPSLARIAWLTHGFSTRPGGVSDLAANRSGSNVKRQAAPDKVLNLGFTDWDSRDRVLENRGKFFATLGASKMRVVALRQIHSDIVHVVGAAEAPQGEQPPQGDALITRKPGVLLTIQTADCIPILLADTRQRAVAAIHSGWRGTAQRIAEKALGRMQMEFGTRPRDVIAALGPGIGGCCYEVGHEVVKEFTAKFPNAREWFAGPFDALENGDNDPNWLPWLTMRPPGHAPPAPRAHLDLIAANRAILADAGVASSNILSSGYCTACRSDLFFSYRRERTTGRLMAAIGIRK
jgi:purine-nucleoside/S-methyl-5'-thioadenosine phosphorylase / adenosine deaminase